jgi:protein-S-isoprenylcysteine O-methyltransferase Ste14
VSAGAAGRDATLAARSRGNARDGRSHARVAGASAPGVATAIGRRVAAARTRLARLGTMPAVPAVLWLLPAIALQATLAAAWPGSPAAFELSLAQGLASLAAIAGGGWLIRAAAAELDWNGTPVCVEEAPRALVATGPYRLGRHPMYLGATLVLVGAALALGSVPAGLVAAAYFGWLDLGHARREDAALHARFGPAWRAYAASTRRWF